MKLCNDKYLGYLIAVVSCTPKEKSLKTLGARFIDDWKSVSGKIVTAGIPWVMKY